MNRTVPMICVLTVLAACGGGDSSAEFGPARQVPKSQRPTVWDAPLRERLGVPDMSKGGQSQGGGGTKVVSATPVGWEELAANPARFRNAVWRVKGQPDTDCYLTLGVGGGVRGNLGRWYNQQFGKSEVPAVEALPPIEFLQGSGRLAEIEGTFAGKADWAALIAFSHQGDRVTSLKFTGPAAVVKGNRSQFLALAKSLRLASGSPNPKAPPIEPGQPMPPGHPPTGSGGTGTGAGGTGAAGPGTGGAAPEPSKAPFTAQAPAGWVPKGGSSRTLHHTFGESGEVYLSKLGGTLKSSFDIWRGEIGLGPMSAAEFEAMPNTMFLGDDGRLLDLTGTFRSMTGRQIPSARLLVAARIDGGTITFCKLVGTVADVAANEDAFRQFCGSVRRAQ